MKLNVYKLGRMLKRLNCVNTVHYTNHTCIVSYVRYCTLCPNNSAYPAVQVPLYGDMAIHDNGNIDYNEGFNHCNDVRPTHPIRHLLDIVYRNHQHKSNLTFGKALEYMKKGYKIARKNWGGYWYLDKYFFSSAVSKTSKMIVAHCKDGSYAPAQAYQCDMLADDWQVLGKENTDEEN